MDTRYSCQAEGCSHEAVTAWIDTYWMTPRGHKMHLICRPHLELLADYNHVAFRLHP